MVTQACLSVTPWTAARQAPLSGRLPRQGYWSFSRQECWRGLPFPSPGDLPDSGIEPGSLALAGGYLTIWGSGEAQKWTKQNLSVSICGVFSARKPDFTFSVCLIAVRGQDPREQMPPRPGRKYTRWVGGILYHQSARKPSKSDVFMSKGDWGDHKGYPDLRWCRARTHIHSDGNPTKLIKHGKSLTCSTTETRGERERETERDARVLPLEGTTTPSHFSEDQFLKTREKKVFNFLSSRAFCISDYLHIKWASLVVQMVKNPAIQEIRVWPLGWEDALGEEMATHSSILAWRIPWTEEPGRLQSVGLQRVRHSCLTEHKQKTLEGGIF